MIRKKTATILIVVGLILTTPAIFLLLGVIDFTEFQTLGMLVLMYSPAVLPLILIVIGLVVVAAVLKSAARLLMLSDYPAS